MATAGEGRAPYESSGAGGKLRKRPFRRSAPATPYDRPATALRNNKPGLLTKLVDPASRLIYAGANKLFGVFRKRLPPLSLQGPPEINEEPQNVSQESGQNNSIGVSKRINQDGNSASISAATGISDLEQMLKQKTFTRSEIQHLTTLLHSRTTDSPSDNIAETNGANPSPLLRIEASTSGSMKKHAAISTPFVSSKVFEESTPSPADVAKSYMGTITRPTTKLMNNTTPFQNTSITPKTANNFKNQENGFLITPRSHGRSAMYSMARTPYSRSPNQNTSHGTSLKRRSSVLEDDFGSVGPLRRTRQKPNLMLQSKKELGYTISQQPMLLKNKPEENGDTIMSKSKSKSTHASVPEKSTQTAMKIFQQLESLTPKSPTKLTSNMLHGQALRSLEKVDSVKYLQTSQCNGESASTSRGKEKVEENGSRKFPVPFNMLTTSTNGNGDVAVLKESAQVVAFDDDDESALKIPPEPPQKKRAFQMSVPEIDDDDDDVEDDDIIHVNGHVSFPPVENNKKLETSPVVNKPVAADIIEVTTPPEVFKTPVAVEAAKVLEPEKAKPPPKTDGFFGEKETGFKFSSTFTTQKDEATPTEKVSPFQFSEYKPKESSEPKPKPIESTSVFSSETKNDQFKVTNTDDKKVEAIPAATSASGMFSFASSAKNSSGPSVTPDSTPSVFSSLASFPASGGNASSVFNNTSTTNITPVTTSSLSSPPPVFSFGSGKAITSMPESSNTEGVIEKEPKSTISSSPFFAATTTAAATTSNGGGLFGFSSPAATSTPATTTTTTNGGGLFGFSSPAATSTTTTAATTNGGGALFGFSAPAATSTTTTTTTSAATNGGGLFGFSAPAATSTAAAAANGGAPFGFSSPAANSTTSTATNAGALFGFGAPAATSTTATATNGGSPFGFSAPATTSTTTTTTAASATNGGALFGFSAPSSTSTTTNATNSSALFGFSAPATTSTTTTTTTTASPLFGFSSPSPTTTPTNSFFNTTTTTSQTNPSSTTQSAPFQFASGPTTSPTFGITPVSEGKSGNSTTTTVFGSSWQQPPPQNPPVFSFGASSSASPTPITFGAPKTTPSSSSMFSFSSSSPVFPNNNNNITNANDQMSMEDSMAEDSMQTPSSVPSPFGQPAAAPGFMFGAPVVAPPQAAAPAPFQFGGPAPQNPFQSSSVEFNGGGGSFSLGSGGEKAGRRIVRVNKSKNRRK